MSATELPDDPVYAFVPVEDADTGFWQVRVLIDGMDIAIGTSLVVLDIDRAMVVADRLNRPLGWTRASWTAFAAARLRAGGGAVDWPPVSRAMSERGAAGGCRAVRPPDHAALTPIAPLRAIRS